MADYDAMEDFTRGFFEHLAATWPGSSISGVRFMRELGRWLEGAGARGLDRRDLRAARRAAVRAGGAGRPAGRGLPRGPRDKGPVVDFFRDYEVALAVMNRFMTPGPGTAAIFFGGGVPKDFIQITATSVSTLRGAEACPHVAAIQITTDNPVFGGLGGAGVNSEAISWGKEAADGDNVMVFADLTIAVPLLCQGLLERYGPRPRASRARRDRAGRRAAPRWLSGPVSPRGRLP